jgi:hypothetical protein
MYELSQRHPVWVAEIHVRACNSVGPCCLDKQVKNVNVLVSDIRLKKGETFFRIFGCHEKSFVLYRRRVEYGVCRERTDLSLQ